MASRVSTAAHDPTVDAVGVGLLLIAAPVAVVWAGGCVAAILGGHAGAHLTITDAGDALVHLGGHLANPASAWPAAARKSLPGALPYWAGQALVVAIITLAAAAGWSAWRRVSRARLSALGVATEAGFAGRADLRLLAVSKPEAGRVTVGRSRGRLLACEPQASLAVIGPTGCGKTAGFAIPALLEWKGPVIATSVKADLLEATIAHRRRRGRVWVYDPTGSSGHPTDTWSPLACCDTWQGTMRTAAWMTQAAQPRLDSVADSDYWYSQGRKALAPYLLAAATSGRTITDVVRWVDAQEVAEVRVALLKVIDAAVHAQTRRGGPSPSRWEDLWAAAVDLCRETLRGTDADWANAPLEQWPRWLTEQMVSITAEEWLAELSTPAEEDRVMEQELNPVAPLMSAQAVWNKEPRLRGSVFATVENVLDGWADPGVGAAGMGSAFNPRVWLSGDNTLYVVAAAHEQARLRPVLTVLIQQAIFAAYDAANDAGGRLANSCLVLLDEAGNITPLRDLPGYASTARSHGITLVSVWQDLAQIKSIYNERAQTVLNNHRAKLFGTGISDPATLDHLSRLIGDEHRTESNLSADLQGGRRTLSEHRTYRPAAPVDALRRLRPSEAVLVYGSELPTHVRLRPWFADGALRHAAGRPDLIQPGGRKRARIHR